MGRDGFVVSDTQGYPLFHNNNISDIQVTGFKNTKRKDHILNICNHDALGLRLFICDLGAI